MNYAVLVKVLQGLGDLESDLARHRHFQWLIVDRSQELLKVPTCHVLHDDAVFVLISELFFKADDVRAVLASVLDLNLMSDAFRIFTPTWLALDDLYGKHLLS